MTMITERVSGPAANAIATTGLDAAELAETRAFNDEMERRLAERPPLYVINDPVASRAAQREGGYGFPPLVRLPEGSWRTVPAEHGGIPMRDIPIRVFVPPRVDGVFLHFHGGGSTIGSADGQDRRLWDLARAANVAVVSVEYRLAPEHPYPADHDDAEQAALWLVENAQHEFGTDRLAIGGESAGARISVATLLRLRDRHGIVGAFRAAQLSFGSYDASMTPSARNFGDRNLLINTPSLHWFRQQHIPHLSTEERRDPDVSPLYADLHDLPPARFVVGTLDPALDDSLFMSARWRAAGNVAHLEVVAEAWHGFTLFPITVARRELAEQDRFIAEAVAPQA